MHISFSAATLLLILQPCKTSTGSLNYYCNSRAKNAPQNWGGSGFRDENHQPSYWGLLIVVLRLLFARTHVCHEENCQASTSSINQSVANVHEHHKWQLHVGPHSHAHQLCPCRPAHAHTWPDGDHQQTQWVQPSLSFRCRCKDRAGCMCIL